LNFVPALTFLNLPSATDFASADAAVFGIPYDCARDAIRFGSRQGPNAIRHASVLTAKLIRDANPNPLEVLNVVDAGNVVVDLEDIGETFSRIESAMDDILRGGCVPVAVGGDGAVSLPQMRALHRAHGPFALLHFDAHTDAWSVSEEIPYTNANQFTHGVVENLLDMDAAVHVGVRGPVNADSITERTRELGYRVIGFSEYRKIGADALLAQLHEIVGDRPVFVCYDMDFFDPSVAPGVATPTPGGAMPEEGLALMRGLRGLNVIGVDINTMTPAHDPSGATAILGAGLLAEALGVLAENRF